jgi:restriction system protein
MIKDKRQRLLELGRERQRACWGQYHQLAEYHGGKYECEWVSPYTKAAGNVDAEIFVLLQDWSCDNELKGRFDAEAAELGYTPGFPTNRNLIRLLKDTFDLELKDVFGTNVFPFIKDGNNTARIPMRDLEKAARAFAVPQIRIVQPSLVVCLGLATFNALQRACGVKESARVAEAIESPFMLDRSQVWCQSHAGALGLINRGRALVPEDWRRMKQDWLKRKAEAGGA